MILFLTCACVVLGAQVWKDPMNYTGPNLSPWVKYRGNWTGTGTQVKAEPKGTRQYLVMPTQTYLNCAIQCVVKYNTASTLLGQYGGVSLRTLNPTQDYDLVYACLADAYLPQGKFLWLLVSERWGPINGRNVLTKSLPSGGIVQATLRLMVVDTLAWAHADTDGNGNGYWDINTSGTILRVTPKLGPIGLVGNLNVLIDDVRLFDAVLYGQNPSPPIGHPTYFKLRGLPSTAYQMASSFGNWGIPVSGGRRIPLWPDNLFAATASNQLPAIFKNFNGILDAKGDAQANIVIPNDQALIGIAFFTAFVNYSGGSILNISNDWQTIIR